MLGKLAVVVVAMFGFGYALVPMYRSICQALGVNVLTLSEENASSNDGVSRQPVNSQVDLARTVTVEFDANARGPWSFKPEQRSVQVHPGEITTVMFDFHNLQNRTLVAQAIPSYAPIVAGAHFNKLQCFCFSQHTLKPGESKRWPVVFVVDDKLPRDVSTITLSYTFFEVGGAVPAAGAATPGGGT
ncbi:MAG: cytochrome c oxidase assembly protein [Burkholderiales bacterium]|nr:cytochrome c oxidase assembly protein [Burkholderiales bacterium]MDE2275988.1 cytochrome c oxidase assembly protein [Burkholderiales bacterium]